MKPNLTCRIVILVVIFAVCLGGALADSYTANTMRLLRYEGDVRIEDASGQPRFIMENARFDSGEAMVTGADGIASVGLDDSKIVTLDVNTRVEFAKSSNALKLTVSEGQLLLDVRQKLDENQTLDIQTSTMAVGIRGTIVYVREQPADAEAQIPGGTTLGVLEGVAEITYQDQAGAARTLAVPAGQKASLPDADGDGRPDDAPALSDITAEDIAGFVARQIAEDGRLIWRVEKASDLLERVADPALSLAADGQWTWREPVRLVAQSASKLYDGQPLTRPSDVLVYGLPSDFTISVSAGGSQTDAGEGENPVSRYAIFNAMGEDVTAHFTAIERVAGVLTVDPAPLTVWTGSAEKIYDGAPLTNPEALLRAVPGYEVDEPLWRDTACVVTDAADAQTLCGLCGSVWVHGTNPLTGETREIELRAGQRMTVYLSSEEGAQSIEFKIESLTEGILLEVVAGESGIDEIPAKGEVEGIEEGIAQSVFDFIDGIGRITGQALPCMPVNKLGLAIKTSAIVIDHAHAPVRRHAAGPECTQQCIGLAIQRLDRNGIASDGIGICRFSTVKGEEGIGSPVGAQFIWGCAHDQIVEEIQSGRNAQRFGNMQRWLITEPQIAAKHGIRIIVTCSGEIFLL